MKYRWLLLLPALLCLSCSEFIEEPITDERVNLLSPGQEADLIHYDVTFMWDALDNALTYRLQVASPNFSAVNQLHADTITEHNKLSISLEPGSYEWRVMAINGSSETDFTSRHFVIYESDFTKQRILLESPANGFVTAMSSVGLQWNSIFSAERYRIQIDTNLFRDPSKILVNEETSLQRFIFTLSESKEYQWRVQAIKGGSVSAWSEIRSFRSDHIKPKAPQPLSPANNQLVQTPVNLTWKKIDDAVSYTLYAFKSDSITSISDKFPARVTETSFTLASDDVPEGQILWRVQAVDEAGNKSDLSEFRKLIIRP